MNIKLLLVFIFCTTFIFSSDTAADCVCKIKVKINDNSKGEVTVTKIKVASVTRVSFASVVSPYSTKWTGTKKIGIGQTKTFDFRVNSGCPIDGQYQFNGHRFRIFRKDGKRCNKNYGSSLPQHQCVPGNTTPVISCGPNSWK